MSRSTILAISLFSLMSMSAHAFKGGNKLQEQPAGFLRFQTIFETVYSICTATKIAPNLYLTAAHCFMPIVDYTITNPNFVPKINILSLKNHLPRNITKLYINPDFIREKEYGGDFALFVLDKDIESIKIAKVDFDHQLKKGQSYRTVGNNNAINEFVLDLHFEDLELQNLIGTSGVFKPKLAQGRVTEGDSGGALYRYNLKTKKYDTVVGVACAKPGFLGNKIYYSRMDQDAEFGVRDWLEGNIEAEMLSREK